MAGSERRDIAEALAVRILDHVHASALQGGAHIRSQDLATRFGVSRFPVGQALQLLADKGVLRHERNRGYFVSEGKLPDAEALGLHLRDETSESYFRIADDHLRGRLPDQVSETYLREAYGLTRAELGAVLNRIAQEGWAERRAGYGWSFTPVLTTPESLAQTYRLRLAVEPAALIEPGYRLPPEVAAHCRAAEERLLAGAIETDSADALHERGVRFHEAIVGASGNPFFLDTVRRINRIRRLLSYRSMLDRTRYRRQCEEHLMILDCLEAGRQEDAAALLRAHLQHTISNLDEIRALLER